MKTSLHFLLALYDWGDGGGECVCVCVCVGVSMHACMRVRGTHREVKIVYFSGCAILIEQMIAYIFFTAKSTSDNLN